MAAVSALGHGVATPNSRPQSCPLRRSSFYTGRIASCPGRRLQVSSRSSRLSRACAARVVASSSGKAPWEDVPAAR